MHHFVSEPHLLRRGLTNYWGYNTLGYFAPHAAYSSSGSGGGQVTEFKTMVKELHAAGIEVILDVVYNHTAEGDHTGPTLSFKGIDNAGYYRLDGGNRARYTDYTGCGNTLDVRRPAVLALLMDSLRYWVTEMHVDGFRFDLASALARSMHDVDRLSAFFDVVHQDPVVSNVKLIAEPWDVGPGGYQVGNFPPPWTEWNGKYRDTVRDVWSGAHVGVRDLAYRLTGSSDLYRSDGRRPFASINFVTAHDGFTLTDLVTYEHKRNEANGEDNRDGESHNRNWNCGVEGPTDDPEIEALRARQVRNHLATLLLSTGVPMLTAGDELGRTQQGNNNAYCQDNEISWIDWKDVDEDLFAFVSRLVRLRRSSPVLRQEAFFEGHEIPGSGGTRDLAWFAPDGGQLSTADWFDAGLQTLGMYLDGRGIRHRDEHGRPVVDDCYLVQLHAGPEPVDRAAARGALGRRLRAGAVHRVRHRRARRRRRSSPPAPVELPGRTVWLLRVLRPAPDSAVRARSPRQHEKHWTMRWTRSSSGNAGQCALSRCGCSKVMTVQPRSRRSPSESGWATPGSSWVHSVASGPATWVPLSDPRSTSETSRPDRWSAAWADESTFWVSAIGTARAEPAATSSWLSGRRPSTRSSSTVTTMPSSKRSTGAAVCSGRQKAVCSPDSARRARAGAGVDARRPSRSPASDDALNDEGAAVAGGAADGGRRTAAASCSIAPEPGTVPSTRS